MSPTQRTRRLFVLGAGASYAVGLPDGDRVLSHLTLYLNGPWLPVPNRTPMKHFAGLLPRVLAYAKEAGFRTGDRFPLDTIFEQFYEAVQRDPAAFHPLLMIWHAIREFVYCRSCDCAKGYRPFAEVVADRDIVLSFNWDLCLEIAMHRLGRSAARGLTRPPERGPWVVKPHGSVDCVVAGSGVTHDMGPRDAFSEDLHPQLTPVLTPSGRLAPGLVRIRTYDLTWQVMTDWTQGLRLEVDHHPRPRPATDDGDVGPLHLDRLLPDAGPFLLTPGSSQVLYEWSYTQTKWALRQVADEIAGIWVIGYSFPRYDEGVQDLLRTVRQEIGDVPVHIVNPAAPNLPADVLRHVFGDVSLHPVGFLEYGWD